MSILQFLSTALVLVAPTMQNVPIFLVAVTLRLTYQMQLLKFAMVLKQLKVCLFMPMPMVLIMTLAIVYLKQLTRTY
ncbi:MAG: hypothetical protein ACXWUF_16585 [Methylomagnum sp.]